MNLPKILLLVATLCCSLLSNYLFSQQDYSTPGTYTWTVPPCVTSVTVQVWGGGGGGGGGWSRTSQTDVDACSGAGGGGGGGFTSQTFAVTPGQTYTVVVGAGGTGGGGGGNSGPATNGQAGGNSSFNGNAINLLATGGQGSNGVTTYNQSTMHLRNNSPGATGGTGSGGTTNLTGGSGFEGRPGGSFDFSGAGGGAAGANTNGFDGNPSVSANAPVGGAGGGGGGKGGDGRKIINGNQAGNNGAFPGGGASGCIAHTHTSSRSYNDGGNGGNGRVYINYSVSGTVPTQPSLISGNTTIPCGGATGTYSVVNVSGVTYTWSYSGTGTISGTGNSITLNATTGGTLTVTPSNDCGNGTPQTLTIAMEQPPTQPSAITGNTTIPCGGGSGTYSVTNVPGVTYTWSYSGTGTITGTGNSITLDATTGGTLTVTPSNACGNGTPRTITISTGTAPTQPSAISGNITIPCSGASGTYSVTNVPGVTYTWSYSGTGTISGTGNSITLDATTGGTLTVTPSNACGNGTPQTITISTGTPPAQPSAITGNTTIPCSGATGTYSVTNVPGITYTWSYSGTGTITGTGNSITLDATTGGTLTVTPSDACGNGTPQTITISTGTPPAQPSAITGNTTIPCGGGSGTYSVTNVPGITYTWSYSGTGTISGTGNSITLDATTGGTLTVTPSDACGNGTPQTITITMGNAPAQPSAITGNTTIPCAGATGTYSVTDVPGTTYTWSYSGTGTISGTGNSITLDATTGGTLTVIPSNACGNGTPQTITIAMDNAPAQPSAISGSNSLCSGISGTYSVTNVPGVTYTWSYSGTGTISGTGNSITLNATTGGTLTVTPSNACGNGTPQTITISISSAPSQPSVIAGNSVLGCGGGSGTYSVTNVPGVTYTWAYSGTGTISGTGNSITLNATTGGTLTVTPSNACGNGNPQTITLTMDNVPAQPSVISGNTVIACSGGTGTYSVTNVPGVTYTWSYSGAGTISGTGNSITLNATAGGTLTVTPSNACGNGTPQTITITTGSITLTAINIIHPSCTGNTDGSASVQVGGGSAPYTYRWQPTGGSNATATNLPAGTYTVTVTDAAGCSNSINIIIQNGSDLAVSLTSTGVDCGSSNGTAIALASGGSGAYTYSWLPNHENTTGITGLSVGTYAVTVSDGTCTITDSIHVGQNNNIAVQVNPSSAVIWEGESTGLNVTFSPYIPGSTYTWTPSGSLSCSNCPNPVASPDETTTYQVTITTPDGCTIDTTISVFVKIKCGDILVPTIFSPNEDGNNDTFFIYGKCITSVWMKIYNRWGELIFESRDKALGWDGNFKGKPVNSGAYAYVINIGFLDGTTEIVNGNVSVVR